MKERGEGSEGEYYTFHFKNSPLTRKFYSLSIDSRSRPDGGKYGNNGAVKIHSPNYYWSDETTALFTRIAGRDISYRVRDRQCKHCYTIFPAVEMPRIYLAAMIDEIQRLEKLADKLQMENNRLKENLMSEEDVTEELEDTIAHLEGGNAKLNAELDHFREGVDKITVLATELTSHQLKPASESV